MTGPLWKPITRDEISKCTIEQMVAALRAVGERGYRPPMPEVLSLREYRERMASAGACPATPNTSQR